ncbi:3-oxoacyl-ACP reductase FabG [Cellvibrio japonicus]|uniref:3-oxoacyl-[acyl-carrier-protein] reductase n=1 Tax=Cellvibrio japonicus (strain Ueda107) TaxID=498211 RepID=B3PEV1_CELJU|nr:3-oxoacyl-ACP reductase FabG [Cellvibrio japonicus]ACE85914.1 3-oxoacyl-(acyl-carrier-protein) reductase [Cellvibrio japonicus Ueda107]QEI12198.1 3-oxoacyl-ACP reductase FabG [Cellvibrio japonicus]QEI15772.1 3-oxoacyl-ACP reductase FabG [Cellvibrio japonicus]QEI19350.1 3-oxoacyl-ACP reductase FabG [Cellvibrio japonicus]
MNINDKVALVTGASRGIGAAIAEQLGKAGAIVIGTATSESGAAKISERFAELGIRGSGKVLNVTDAESVANLLKAVGDEFGAPAILVNNAGITKDNLLMRMSDEEWFDVINTNLSAIYRLSKGVLRGMMKARWGRIINISSVVGSMGNPGQSNYAATKAGVSGFARSLAAEVGSRNITVNTVAPGFIDTDMTKALPEEQKAQLMARIPLGRLGAPEEIAAVVLFLASDAAGYISGETIHVNGGMYMS